MPNPATTSVPAGDATSVPDAAANLRPRGRRLPIPPLTWALAGVAYAAVYVVLVLALGDNGHARLIAGTIGLLLPPMVPLVVFATERRRWRGRQKVFWTAVAAWPTLWLVGQIGWSLDEVVRNVPLPWFRGHIVLQLCASALPLIALIAQPHRGTQRDSGVTTAVDIIGLAGLTSFLYWSLIIAPGMEPPHAPSALRALAIIGPSVRLAALAGLLWAMRRAVDTGWVLVYQRLALGMLLAFTVLVGLSLSTVHGTYRTGAPDDIGWMLPFWFAAWAMADAPASAIDPPRAIGISRSLRPSATLLCAAVLAVPVVGFGAQYMVPASSSVERLREVTTLWALVGGIVLVMVRLVLERRSVDAADQKVRTLAIACEHAGELILILRESRIEYANEAFCAATGYSRSELYALGPMRLVARESRRSLPAVRDRLRGRKIVRTTTTLARRDGTAFPAAWSGAPIADAAGRVTGIVAVLRDATEELHHREELVRSERLAAIGTLLSHVTNEINNPLQSVIGTMDMLLAGVTDGRLREDLERARDEASRAGRVIRKLLPLVRKSPAEKILHDFNEIVQTGVAAHASALADAGIEVREEYARDLPLVLVNPDEIRQVIGNLIANAQMAIAGAGRRGALTVRTYAAGDRAVVEVQDDGPGVPPELAARVFEPFSTTNPTGAGSGLGLSTSFGIATGHRGALELVPTGGGACFRLTLPGAGFAGPVPPRVH